MRTIVVFAFSLLMPMLVACGGSSSSGPNYIVEQDNTDTQGPETEVPVLSKAFGALQDYGFSDFELKKDVLYWEMRLGPRAGALDAPTLEEGMNEDIYSRTLWSYDTEQFQLLSEDLRAQVSGAESRVGFVPACQPDYCPVFAAAVTETGVDLQVTHRELLALFDYIDTEAELNLWLWANEHNGLSYDAVQGGYNVITHWIDPMCIEDKYYRLFVDYSGVITEIETVLIKAPIMCS